MLLSLYQVLSHNVPCFQFNLTNRYFFTVQMCNMTWCQIQSIFGFQKATKSYILKLVTIIIFIWQQTTYHCMLTVLLCDENKQITYKFLPYIFLNCSFWKQALLSEINMYEYAWLGKTQVLKHSLIWYYPIKSKVQTTLSCPTTGMLVLLRKFVNGPFCWSAKVNKWDFVELGHYT